MGELSAEDRAVLERQHQSNGWDNGHGYTHCVDDEEVWPCRVARLLATLDDTREQLRLATIDQAQAEAELDAYRDHTFGEGCCQHVLIGDVQEALARLLTKEQARAKRLEMWLNELLSVTREYWQLSGHNVAAGTPTRYRRAAERLVKVLEELSAETRQEGQELSET